MTGPVALKAAYIVTWVILLGYLGSLLAPLPPRARRDEGPEARRDETNHHRDTEAQRNYFNEHFNIGKLSFIKEYDSFKTLLLIFSVSSVSLW